MEIGAVSLVSEGSASLISEGNASLNFDGNASIVSEGNAILISEGNARLISEGTSLYEKSHPSGILVRIRSMECWSATLKEFYFFII